MNDLDVRAKIEPVANGKFQLVIWRFAAAQGMPTKTPHAAHDGFLTIADARAFAQQEYGLSTAHIRP